MIKKIAPKSYALVDTKTLEIFSPVFADSQDLRKYCLKNGLNYEDSETVKIIDNESYRRLKFQMKTLDAMFEHQRRLQANAASVQDLVQFRPFRVEICRGDSGATEIY